MCAAPSSPDVLAGKAAMEIVERDDGFVMAFDARDLVASFRRWDDPLERRAMRFVRGRVVDVGCDGGRVCLHLQERALMCSVSIPRRERSRAVASAEFEMLGCSPSVT